jgi:hypothetical protein
VWLSFLTSLFPNSEKSTRVVHLGEKVDVLGRTRATLMHAASLTLDRQVWVIFERAS